MKKLEVSNGKLSKDRKIYLNATTIFSTYIPIIKTKSVRFYAESLTARFQDLFIRLLVFKRGISKVI